MLVERTKIFHKIVNVSLFYCIFVKLQNPLTTFPENEKTFS
jgi:hypothetical protein